MNMVFQYDVSITRWFYSLSFGRFEHIHYFPSTWPGKFYCSWILIPSFIYYAQKPDSFIYPIFSTFIAVAFGYFQYHGHRVSKKCIPIIIFTTFVTNLIPKRTGQIMRTYFCIDAISLIIVLFLKSTTKRVRPMARYLDFDKNRKLYSVDLTQGREREMSFPSGDVCKAVTIAHALHNSGLGKWIFLLVIWSMVGRMYYGAHHFSDVVTGAFVGEFCQYFLHSLLTTVGVPETLSCLTVLIGYGSFLYRAQIH